MRVLIFSTRNGIVYLTEYGQVVLRHGVLTVSKFLSVEEAQRFFAEHESGRNNIQARSGPMSLRLEGGGLRFSASDLDWSGQVVAVRHEELESPPPF